MGVYERHLARWRKLPLSTVQRAEVDAFVDKIVGTPASR
jgi:hypothetical protein